MRTVIIKQGAVPPAKKKRKRANNKYAFLSMVDWNEYAMLGKLDKREYRNIVNRLYAFNKDGSKVKKLGMRTTDQGVVIYRKR